MRTAGETSGDGRPGRPYDTSRRREQARRTRRRILAAAQAEFLASGFTGTTMRRVAEAAAVSLPLVEQAFGTKARLLSQVVDVAIAGDDEPVPVLARESAARAAAAEQVEDFLQQIAALLTEGQVRSARLVLVVLEAAATDPIMAGLAHDRLAQRARTAEWIVDGLLARGPLRPGMDPAEAVDTVWLLMDPVVFCRLTEDRGWSAPHYQEWFADSVQRLILSASSGARRPVSD